MGTEKKKILACNIGAIKHGPDACDFIAECLADNAEEYGHYLIGDLTHQNFRAECDNGIEIDKVEHVSGNEYALSYSYDWVAWSPCKDLRDAGTEEDGIYFTIDDSGDVIMDVIIIEPRCTFEEF